MPGSGRTGVGEHDNPAYAVNRTADMQRSTCEFAPTKKWEPYWAIAYQWILCDHGAVRRT